MTDKLGANGEKTDGMDHSGGGSFELNNEQNDYESEQEYLDVLANGSESDREDGPPAPQNNATLLQFHEYLDKAQYFTPLTGKIRTAIKLLKNLRRTKASLGTYDMMMRWHLEANGVIDEQDSLKLCPDFISKEKLYKYLARRYNRDEGYGNIEEIVLPSTKQKARIVWNDAAKVIQSLLVDPRIRDEDYLFFNNDPLCPPPADLNYYADLNTGKCYMATYKKLIVAPEKEVLLPIVFYIDGATTGQFVDLELIPVKIALGIFTMEARKKGHFWGTLGYIPTPSKVKSHGKRQLIDSGHVEGGLAYHQMLENEGRIDPKSPTHKAQDLHAMLEVILKSYLKLQEEGIKWSLLYRKKTYDVQFKLFVPFIRCDTDEADKLCGSYTARGPLVAQLCRQCCCPTDESDDPWANYAPKTVEKLVRLVQKKDFEGLRALSQQYIQNALYKVRFGAHNKQGVHGGCPLEMLHGILLGMFTTVRDTFFELCGPTSQLAKDFDAFCSEIGWILSRQSDRNMPHTRFFGGIRKGRLMARDFTGVLLVITCALATERGRKLLSKRKYFKIYGHVEDWVMLLELLLMWEAWLKQPQMDKALVARSEKKHIFILQLVRKVSPRSAGMGLKTTKFHMVTHITQQIKDFGVPSEVNTDHNEAHHKPGKTAAGLTQKNKAVFEEQTHKRLEEVELLALAQEEINGRPLWDYYSGQNHPEEVMEKQPGPPAVEGRAFLVYRHPSGRKIMCDARKIRGKHQPITVEQDFVDFLVGLQDKVFEHIGKVVLRSLHKRNGHLFRGHSMFHGSVWRDWVKIDWGRGYGQMPCKIWGFVDLRGLPTGRNGISYAGTANIGPGMYAIVECASVVDENDGGYQSAIICEIETEVGDLAQGFVTQMKYYLADVEAFVEPIVVFPNIGGKNNSYLWLEKRESWHGMFKEWLRSDHNNDDIRDEEFDAEEDVSVADPNEAEVAANHEASDDAVDRY